jgi:hypothetical protein
MLEQFEWVALVTTALIGGVVLGRRSLAILAWLRSRALEGRLTCPKRGSIVECTLRYDEGRRTYLDVERCSVFEGGPVRCERECVRLLNLGIPLDDGPAPLPSAQGASAHDAPQPGVVVIDVDE